MTDLETLLRTMIATEVEKALATHSPSEYLSIAEAADRAKVHPATIRRWVRQGRLPGHRAGRHLRIKSQDLEDALKPRFDMGPEARALKDFG